MEYCDGGSLKKLISGVDLTEGQIAHICKEVCENFIHIIHIHIKQNCVHSWILAKCM